MYKQKQTSTVVRSSGVSSSPKYAHSTRAAILVFHDHVLAQQDLDNPSLFTFNATGWCLIASVLFALCRPACTRWYEFRYSPSLLPTTCASWQQNYIVLLLVNLPSLCLSTRSPRIRNTSFLFFCTELLLAAGLPHRNALANNETGVLTEGWKTAHL
ncbi:hypothetical protein OUZ56_001492 [Daphnia magna]|uniref:Uncharacterized protein n=1 Tax=Daphnia magna TaxID=35525 RepID=A0ABR0A2U3_9CRUS|nr:hypothetical protein OUZ56_001492 [Daphnia magna]